jgi:hypothetical protein
MHEWTEIEDHKDTTNRTRCTHNKSRGGRCGSPALRGGNLCYFHSEQRGSVDQIRERKARHRSITLSSIRTREEIQRAIEAVMQAIAGAEIDSRRAGLLLYSLQIAASNINQHQNNHFKALPRPMQYLADDHAELIAEDERRESRPHYGTGPHPQFTADGDPVSQTPGYVSAERKDHDEAIPDFSGRPGQWEKLSNGTGALLLESLGKHYSNDRPLTGTPKDRDPKPQETSTPATSQPLTTQAPETYVLAAVQATAQKRQPKGGNLAVDTAVGCPISGSFIARCGIIRAKREPHLSTPGRVPAFVASSPRLDENILRAGAPSMRNFFAASVAY